MVVWDFLFELCTSLFDSVLYIYFILRYNGASFRTSKLTVPAILLLFGVTVLGDHLLPGFSTLISITLFLIATSFSLWVSKKNKLRAIIASCIYEISFILLSSLLYMGMSMFLNDFDQLMQGSSGLGRYIYVLLHKIALFTTLHLVLRIFRAENLKNIWNGVLAFVFSLTTMLGLWATMYMVATPDGDVFKTQILIIVLSFILVNVLLYILLHQIQRLEKTKYELKLLEEKMSFEETRYNDASAIWNNVRKVQHDMKQHLVVMAGFLEQEEPKKCQEYINSLLPEVDQIGKLVRSNNAVLDYLINSKLCALKDTSIVISGSIGDLSDIRDVDLACLIGNILDNAIEALSNVSEKRIELLFSVQNDNRVIICKNTINESVLKNNRELKSTKASGNSHGWGHQIVAKIVSDYHGMVDYFEEFGMFGVQIILPNNKKVDDLGI